MPPAQPLMDIDPNYKPNSIKVEVDIDNENILAKLDGADSRCIKSCGETVNEGGTLLDEKKPPNSEDVAVDIVTCKNVNETGSAEAEDTDATEYSSSFANTFSDTEKCSGLSEPEVESPFYDDSDLASPYDAFNSIFQTRKKKLTNHWRTFIRPLMWRCKWAELKIKEIESQALKYSKELSAYEQRKHSRIYQSTFEGFCSKALPFSNQRYKRRAIKRRKRKRIEETTDTASYMLNHNLFSYLENKRSNPDASSTIDCLDNAAIGEQRSDVNDKFGIDNDELSFEFEDGDHSLERILWKIEVAQTRIHKLKNQLDTLMSKNAAMFSSSENLSLLAPGDAQTSSAPSPTFSAGNGETLSVGAMHNIVPHISGYDIGDLMLPDTAISSYAEAIHVPDIIESTVGLLSATDVTFHQPQIGDSCEDILDNVSIHNETIEGDTHTFIGTSNKLQEEHHEPEKAEVVESTNPCPIPTSEVDPTIKTTVAHEQSTLKSCLASDIQFPRNKRKRGERKVGSVGWNKKCSGEPDSQ